MVSRARAIPGRGGHKVAVEPGPIPGRGRPQTASGDPGLTASATGNLCRC